jgi:hypothetical protein
MPLAVRRERYITAVSQRTSANASAAEAAGRGAVPTLAMSKGRARVMNDFMITTGLGRQQAIAECLLL